MYRNSLGHSNCCFNSDNCRQKVYQIAVMVEEGEVCLGRTFDSLEEVKEAVNELTDIYGKYGVSHHVGYLEV